MSDKKNELFGSFVMMMAMQAMQHMGKVMNPMTNKIERHLDAAQQVIDLLDMLEEKTKGNLSAEETRLLKHVLGDLKLNYVEEMNADKAAPASSDAKSADGDAKPAEKPAGDAVP